MKDQTGIKPIHVHVLNIKYCYYLCFLNTPNWFMMAKNYVKNILSIIVFSLVADS